LFGGLPHGNTLSIEYLWATAGWRMATEAYQGKPILGATSDHLQSCSDCRRGFLGVVYVAALPSSDKSQCSSAPLYFGGTCEHLLLRRVSCGTNDSGISKQSESKPPTLAALVYGDAVRGGSRELLDR
jgi:hypothetical protein